MGGVAVLYHNPKGKVPEFGTDNMRFSNYGQWVALRPLGTEGQHSPYYSRDPYSIGRNLPYHLEEALG